MARKQPITGKSNSAIKPEKARKLINKFHALNKARSQSEAIGDLKQCAAIDDELTKLGGLKTYQAASICGQSNSRGGDSSKIMMQWIPQDFHGSLLEVGCLQVDNCCARSKRFSPHIRIDLHSQHPSILEQDFLTMKTPTTPFDIISLSLVVNYVPNSTKRGSMLLKAHRFLQKEGLLFFVLPRACIDNSRYCNDDVMNQLFTGIGFKVLESKKTSKLIYWMLRKEANKNNKGFRMPKTKVRDGPQMNNFSIVVSNE